MSRRLFPTGLRLSAGVLDWKRFEDIRLDAVPLVARSSMVEV